MTNGILTDNDKASAINLAFLFEISCYDEKLLKYFSENFTKEEKEAIYEFWSGLTPVCQEARVHMEKFERKV